MIISPDLANRFINAYKRFLLAIYEPGDAERQPPNLFEKLHAARERFAVNRSLLDNYMSALEDGTEPIDRQMMLVIKNVQLSRWVYLRDLKSYSIFLKRRR